MTALSSPPPVGRPRDPDISARALDAALEVYGEAGWNGFTMEAVATRARIGKAALYLRWPTKEALLVDALDTASPHVTTDTALPPRDVLLALGRQMYAQYTGRYGPAVVRMAIEAPALPAAITEGIRTQMQAEWRAGIAALEAAGVASPALLIETLGGAILMRALYTGGIDEARATRDPEAFVAAVVDLVLAP